MILELEKREINHRSENKSKNLLTFLRLFFLFSSLSLLFAPFIFNFFFIQSVIFCQDWLDFSVCLTQMDCKRKQYPVGYPVASGLENDTKYYGITESPRENIHLIEHVKWNY